MLLYWALLTTGEVAYVYAPLYGAVFPDLNDAMLTDASHNASRIYCTCITYTNTGWRGGDWCSPWFVCPHFQVRYDYSLILTDRLDTWIQESFVIDWYPSLNSGVPRLIGIKVKDEQDHYDRGQGHDVMLCTNLHADHLDKILHGRRFLLAWWFWHCFPNLIIY